MLLVPNEVVTYSGYTMERIKSLFRQGDGDLRRD